MSKINISKSRNQETNLLENKDQKAGKSENYGLLYEFKLLVIKIVVIVIVFVLIFTFLFGLFRSNDPGMYPAIKDGDLVVFDRTDKSYVKTDVAVIKYKGKYQARRVLAIEGDTVDITEEGLYINGYLQQERDIYEKVRRYEKGVDFPLKVGKGQVFLLGDARNNATDSRVYGCVDISDTFGKVMTLVRRRGV